MKIEREGFKIKVTVDSEPPFIWREKFIPKVGMKYEPTTKKP